ncbi:MAG: hypothetical protein IPM92_14915 [Saprospiraceae bacterium]|nr:hypothetical protein [Saprospiraceae bacterium]
MIYKLLLVFISLFLTGISAGAQAIKIGSQSNDHKVIVREFVDTLITMDTVNGYEDIRIMKSSGIYLKLVDCQRLMGIINLGLTRADLNILRYVSNIQTYCIPKQDPSNWKIVNMQLTIEKNGFDPLTFEETEMKFSDALQTELEKLNAGDRVVVNKLQMTGPGGRTCMFSFSVVGD